MAIRILLDHGVREDRIVLVTFLAGPCGVSVLGRIFPQVKIFTGGIDSGIQEIWLEGNQEIEGRKIWCLEPGMGQIGSLSIFVSSNAELTLFVLDRRPLLSLKFFITVDM
jgi:Uracil phosphoribosyltransferase